MGLKLMLDTNAYSGLMRGEEWAANEVRAAEHIYIPAVVMGELLYGFRLGKRNSENRRQLSEFLALRHADFHPAGQSVCERYALVMEQLRRKGRPIPTNDVWVAAHTLAEAAELLTMDKHFQEIDGLSILQI